VECSRGRYGARKHSVRIEDLKVVNGFRWMGSDLAIYIICV